MSQPTREQAVQAAVQLLSALLEAIIGSGGSIPNGHLYAMVMSRIEFDLYTSLIAKLVEVKFITNSHHLLTITEEGRAWHQKIETKG